MKLSAQQIKLLQLAFGFAISGLCLWLALRHVPVATLIVALNQASYIWLVPAVIIQLLAVLTRAERWRVLLDSQVNLSDAFWAQGIGYLFTNVLPFRLGEPARIAALAARGHLPLAHVAATAILERLLDVATVLLVLAGILPVMNVPVTVQQAGMLFGLMVVIGLGFIIALVNQGDRGTALIRSWGRRLLPRYAEAITARWQELLQGFAGVTQARVAGPVVAWSAASWACSIGMYWCVLRAFQPLARPVEAAFMVTALSLAVTVPSGPGFIGVFQWVGQQALVLPFGVKYDAANALAITLIVHFIYYLLTTALGVMGLWQFGESFTQLGRFINRQPAVLSSQAEADS